MIIHRLAADAGCLADLGKGNLGPLLADQVPGTIKNLCSRML